MICRMKWLIIINIKGIQIIIDIITDSKTIEPKIIVGISSTVDNNFVILSIFFGMNFLFL